MNQNKTNILIITGNSESQKTIISAISNQNDLQIIGVENDEVVAIIKVEKLKPDVLVIDIQLPGIDGIELAPMVHRRSPSTSIIMISDKDDNDYANIAVKAGISGFLLRKTDLDKLIPVIKIVSLGGHFISSSIIKRSLETIMLMRQFSGKIMDKIMEIKNGSVNNANGSLSFSVLEHNIITDISKGFSDKEIAEHLNYSVGAIRNSMVVIKRKLNFKNRIQIVAFSLIYGVICPDITNRQFHANPVK